MIERDTHYEMVYGDAMLDEMEKMAGIGSALKGMLKRPVGAAKGMSAINQGRLAGTALGAGAGAAHGAATNEGDRTGGALRGAMLGGVLGLGAGQVATKAGRAQTKRFGQRQLHGMTGYVPRSTAQKARGVGFSGKGLSSQERLQSLKGMGMDIGKNVSNRPAAIQDALAKQTVSKSLSPKMRKRLAEMEVSGIAARREAAEKGLTSIPGVAKGLVRNPLKTLKTGFVAQGPLGMALATVPTAMMLPGAVRGEGFGEEYSDKGGIGRMLGENVGYAALGAAPIAPMIAGATLAGKAGELLHRGGKSGVDKYRAGRVTR